MTAGKTQSVDLSPIHKTIEVEAPIEVAFRVFTEEMGTWWPTETHAMDEGRVLEIVFEPRVGGRVYEVAEAGEGDWATVTAWEPPHRLVLAWKPNTRPTPPTEVEVRFEALGPGRTRLELVHGGWEHLAEEAADAAEGRTSYLVGWDPVLARFADRVTEAARAGREA